MVAQHFAALAGLKRVFHKLDACGGNRVRIPVFRDLCITNSPHSDPSRHVTLSEAEGSGSEGWGVVVRRAGDSSLRSE